MQPAPLALALFFSILSSGPMVGATQRVEVTTADAPSFDLAQVGSGEMLACGARGQWPLPRLDTRVRIVVEGLMVQATLTQRFENPSSETIEALYVFPLPEGASVHHMEIRVGNRRIVSRVEERREAQRTYETAKQQGRKAALVEQDRPDLFRASVANVNPGETIEVVLEIVDEVLPVDGVHRWIFPLTFTPRFVPPDAPADAGRIQSPFLPAHHPDAPTAAFEAFIRPGLPVSRVTCSSHEVEVTEENGRWRLRPPATLLAADRDLVLEWEPRAVDAPVQALLLEPGEAADHALVLVRPPEVDTLAEGEGFPTETLFVIDVSGSMDGPSIRHARSALLSALDRLRPTDRFALVAFNDHSVAFADRFLPAQGRDLERARRWVRGLRAHGGTMIFPALLHGLGIFAAVTVEPVGSAAPADAEAPLPVRRMIFLTDGAVANEGQMIERLRLGLGRVRLHTIGIGYAPNRALMRKMAAVGGGLCTFVASVEEADEAVDRFYARLERPVWTDLRLEWTGVTEVQQSPERLPDLHAGEPLYVSARLEGVTGRVGAVLWARSQSGQIERRLRANVVNDGVALSQRWARRRVETLLDSLHEGRPMEEVRPAVVALGRAHHIVTPYTSLVAEEEIVTAATATRSTAVANALPHGSRLMQGALPRGGTDGPLRLRLGVVLLLASGLVAIVLRGGR